MADVYVVLQILTTADEHGAYVTKDASEIIELGWNLVDAKTLKSLAHDSVLVKPISTPITPLCTNQTTLTWETVRNAGNLKDAITKLDEFLTKNVVDKGLQFSFVSLNSWDLRVKLPKESRERSIMLPPYLELPRYFDLKKEFQKYQEESKDHSPLLQNGILAQMVFSLQVDLNGITAVSSIKPVAAGQLNGAVLNMPRRASDDVQIVTRILCGFLQRKALTKPHDLHLDMKQFFTEKSKILFMTNLPQDTTQSELESWFTQFGGRPIAFWALRQAQQESNKTSAGFAIFGTHDEAIDSLAMNGRVLNEKIVEVQPSSVRVLERAQEILTPFPSSKNRPRPGDWSCPSCGFSNFQRRTACFRCSFPAASAPTLQDSYYDQAHNNHKGGNVPFRAGDWKCPNENCSYHNFAKNICCLKCSTPRIRAAQTSNTHGQYYGQDLAHRGYHQQMRSFSPMAQQSVLPAVPQQQFQQHYPTYHNYDQQLANVDALGRQINGMSLNSSGASSSVPSQGKQDGGVSVI